MAFFLDYVHYNFVLVILALVVLLMLVIKPKVSNVNFRPLYITVGSILLCSVLDRMETFASADPTLYTQRLFLSVACYWLRPIFCLGLIYVIVTARKKRLLILIPEFINITVMSLAFLPGIGRYVFYFDDDFVFCRGPLGLTVFIVGFIYVFYLVYLVLFHLREKKARESLVIIASAICILLSTVAEAAGHLQNTTSSLVIVGCILYYQMICFQLITMDALTRLYKREVFYDDIKDRHITAIASIDMNGLKQVNDTQGHLAGDAALAAIAGVILAHAGPGSRGYRVGGDEFIMIFRNMPESAVREACEQIRAEVEQAGWSVSLGYAYSPGAGAEELVKLSDECMYEDKNAYYAALGCRR